MRLSHGLICIGVIWRERRGVRRGGEEGEIGTLGAAEQAEVDAKAEDEQSVVGGVVVALLARKGFNSGAAMVLKGANL